MQYTVRAGQTLFGEVADAAQILRLRRALARANRVRLELVEPAGAVVPTSFVNLLESPADSIPLVLAGFAYAPIFIAALPSPPRRRLRKGS